MAMIRLQPFTTTLTADGTTAGVLTLASTAGITRHACLSVAGTGEGWRIEVIRVVDGTHIIARMTGFMAVGPSQPNQGNVNNLSALKNGATVILEEQWVPDLYQDDVPTNLAIPTK
jgi:hypothetical protein